MSERDIVEQAWLIFKAWAAGDFDAQAARLNGLFHMLKQLDKERHQREFNVGVKLYQERNDVH